MSSGFMGVSVKKFKVWVFGVETFFWRRIGF